MPSSPNGPCRTGKATSAVEQAAGGAQLDLVAVGEPAPVALDQDRDHLVARLAQAVGDRGARAQRHLVLARAPAAQHRDPHQGGPVVVVGRGSWSWWSAELELADEDGHELAGARRVPALGDCSTTRPSSFGSVGRPLDHAGR